MEIEKLENRYVIGDLIGEGGMGAVYSCWDSVEERTLAVKIIAPNILAGQGAAGNFKKEVGILSRLQHPNVLKIIHHGEQDGIGYMITEIFIDEDGVPVTLKRFQEQYPDNRLPRAELLHVFSRLLNGLAYLHEKGILHRDLKPENVLLCVDEEGFFEPILTDFGLASLAIDENGNSTFEDSITISVRNKDANNAIIGTYSYMSPEQRQGLELDARSDVYSLGVMMYRLATGFQRLNPELPSEVNPELPVWLDNLIEKSVESDRNDRWQDAVEIVDRFGAHFEQPVESETNDLPLSTPDVAGTAEDMGIAVSLDSAAGTKADGSRSKLVLLAIAALVVIAAIVGAIMLLPRNEAPVTEGQQATDDRSKKPDKDPQGHDENQNGDSTTTLISGTELMNLLRNDDREKCLKGLHNFPLKAKPSVGEIGALVRLATAKLDYETKMMAREILFVHTAEVNSFLGTLAAVFLDGGGADGEASKIILGLPSWSFSVVVNKMRNDNLNHCKAAGRLVSANWEELGVKVQEMSLQVGSNDWRRAMRILGACRDDRALFEGVSQYGNAKDLETKRYTAECFRDRLSDLRALYRKPEYGRHRSTISRMQREISNLPRRPATVTSTKLSPMAGNISRALYSGDPKLQLAAIKSLKKRKTITEQEWSALWSCMRSRKNGSSDVAAMAFVLERAGLGGFVAGDVLAYVHADYTFSNGLFSALKLLVMEAKPSSSLQSLFYTSNRAQPPGRDIFVETLISKLLTSKQKELVASQLMSGNGHEKAMPYVQKYEYSRDFYLTGLASKNFIQVLNAAYLYSLKEKALVASCKSAFLKPFQKLKGSGYQNSQYQRTALALIQGLGPVGEPLFNDLMKLSCDEGIRDTDRKVIAEAMGAFPRMLLPNVGGVFKAWGESGRQTIRALSAMAKGPHANSSSVFEWLEDSKVGYKEKMLVISFLITNRDYGLYETASKRLAHHVTMKDEFKSFFCALLLASMPLPKKIAADDLVKLTATSNPKLQAVAYCALGRMRVLSKEAKVFLTKALQKASPDSSTYEFYRYLANQLAISNVDGYGESKWREQKLEAFKRTISAKMTSTRVRAISRLGYVNPRLMGECMFAAAKDRNDEVLIALMDKAKSYYLVETADVLRRADGSASSEIPRLHFLTIRDQVPVVDGLFIPIDGFFAPVTRLPRVSLPNSDPTYLCSSALRNSKPEVRSAALATYRKLDGASQKLVCGRMVSYMHFNEKGDTPYDDVIRKMGSVMREVLKEKVAEYEKRTDSYSKTKAKNYKRILSKVR